MALFKLKWPSRCNHCGAFLAAGESARWHKVWGHSCADTEACEKRKGRNVAEDHRPKLEGSEEEPKPAEVVDIKTRLPQ